MSSLPRMGRLTGIVSVAAIVVVIIGCGGDSVSTTTTTVETEVTVTSLVSPPGEPHRSNDYVPPSERCGADKLTNCDATSACTIKFGIDPDDPDGWDQPPGWIACLKHYGASKEIIRQYQPD